MARQRLKAFSWMRRCPAGADEVLSRRDILQNRFAEHLISQLLLKEKPCGRSRAI